jgi:hypothetical protein
MTEGMAREKTRYQGKTTIYIYVYTQGKHNNKYNKPKGTNKKEKRNNNRRRNKNGKRKLG